MCRSLIIYYNIDVGLRDESVDCDSQGLCRLGISSNLRCVIYTVGPSKNLLGEHLLSLTIIIKQTTIAIRGYVSIIVAPAALTNLYS
jgi:hypothetical protein